MDMYRKEYTPLTEDTLQPTLQVKDGSLQLTEEEWKVIENRYYDELTKSGIDDTGYFNHEWVLSHFKKELTQAKEAEREAITRNIGMLRQWLNEDRIKDADRFVTNDDIKLWLYGETAKEQPNE